MERDYRLHGIFTSLLIYLFYLSISVPSKGGPYMFPNRVPMDRDTPSPEPLVCSLIHSFIHLLIHISLLESPKKSPPTYGEKQKVTVHGAPRRQKIYIYWGAAWFPKRIFKGQTVQEQCTPVPNFLLGQLDPWWKDQTVVPKHQSITTNQYCVTSLTSKNLCTWP